MNKLIIVRHGRYGSDGRLNTDGRQEVAALAEKLRSIVDGRVAILTSPAPRARESAEILGSILGYPMEERDILWSDEHHDYDYEGVLGIIDSVDCDVLLLVTHFEYTEGFPNFFGGRKFGVRFPSLSVAKGHGVAIDCRQKTIVHI